MKRRMLLISLIAVLLCQCGAGDSTAMTPALYALQGSVTQVLDLGYDEARIELAPEDVSLVFARKRALTQVGIDGGVGMASGQSEEYPLKVAYSLWGQAVPSELRVDLAEKRSDAGMQRGIASRNVVNDPRTAFPALVRGTVFFNGKLLPNETVRGDFHMTFENGTQAASGRTIFGSFSAKVSP